MRKTILISAIAALGMFAATSTFAMPMFAPAAAQVIKTNQHGWGNEAGQTQILKSSHDHSYGTRQLSDVDQFGMGNGAFTFQKGTAKQKIYVNQTGAYNYSDNTQIGKDQLTVVNQSGVGNSAVTYQETVGRRGHH